MLLDRYATARSVRKTPCWKRLPNTLLRRSSATAVRAAWVIGVLTMATSGWAQSDDDRGWYVGATVGRTYNGADFVAFSDSGFGTVSPAADFEEALSVGATAGYRFGNGLRLEGEYLYRTNELETLALPLVGMVDGDYSSVAVSANAYYDFLRSRRIRPYLGVGLSWLQEVDLDVDLGDGETSFETDGTGVQAMFGVLFDVSRRWTIDFQVRSLDADEVDMEAEVGPGLASVDYAPVNLQLGLVYRF